MNTSKNIFSALSDESKPKPAQTQGKKKGKKKSVPISLHDPPVHAPVQAAPRHPMRTEMTEDEELSAALEASKREAEKMVKAKQIQQPQQQQAWSSLVKSTPSTASPVSSNGSNGSNASASVGNAKGLAAPVAATNTAKAAATTMRSPTNPWASNLAVPSKSTDPSLTPPYTNASVSPVSNASSLTTHTIDPSEEDQDSDEEIPMIPISTRPVATTATPIKPIARPIQSNGTIPSNHEVHTLNSILSDEDSDNQISLGQLSFTDHRRPSPTASSHPNLEQRSLFDESILHTLSQTQDTLQQALTRISQLEQNNELLMTRMTRIVEASVHLEQSVASTVAENTLLKSQIAELRANFLLSSTALASSAGNNPTGLYSTQNGFHSYFHPQGFSTGPRTQNPQSVGLGLSNGLYSASVPHTQQSNMVSATEDAQHGFSAPMFAANGYHS